MNKFKRLLYFFILPGFIVFTGCKKEDEKINLPVIQIVIPSTGDSFQVYDKVIVEAIISSVESITSVSVSIIGEYGIPVAQTIFLTPNQTGFTINEELTIDNYKLETGNYKVQVTASNGTNIGKAAKEIFIHAIPKRFRGLLIISQQNSLKTTISKLDSAYHLENVKNINDGYISSSLSSYWQYLLFSSPSPSGLSAYKLNNYQIAWQYSPASPFSEVNVAYAKDNYLYAGSGNGNIIEFYESGGIKVMTQVDLDRKPELIFRHNNYIITDQSFRTKTEHILVTYYSGTGAITNTKETNFEVIGFGSKDNDKVIAFANHNEQGIIKIYDFILNQFSLVDTALNGKFYAKIDVGNVFLLAHDNGIFQYNPNSNQLTLVIPTPGQRFLAFDEVNSVLFAAKNNLITLYDYPSGGIINIIATDFNIKDIHVQYNR